MTPRKLQQHLLPRSGVHKQSPRVLQMGRTTLITTEARKRKRETHNCTRSYFGASATTTAKAGNKRVFTMSPLPVQRMCLLLPELYSSQQPPAHRASCETELPWCFHWLFFHEATRLAALGEDGHVRLSNTPVGRHPRFQECWSNTGVDMDHAIRMWAGGTIRSKRPVLVSERLHVQRAILNIEPRQSTASGHMVFVTTREELRTEDSDELVLQDDRVVVYKERHSTRMPPPPPPPPVKSADSQTWTRVPFVLQPSTMLLFQYSALTHNAHRIHYDADYCRRLGYEGVVVHGPLLATVLAAIGKDVTSQNGRTGSGSNGHLGSRETVDVPFVFDYRARRPAFVGQSIHFAVQSASPSSPSSSDVGSCVSSSGGCRLRAEDDNGNAFMTASMRVDADAFGVE